MIDLQREGAVFVLRMDAGENRINRESLDELGRMIDEVEAASGECALVTTGTGKFYSNGFDIPFLMSQGPKLQDFVQETVRFFARILMLPMPTVAAINGHQFAAGAMLAASHDARFMREDKGFFCLPEVDLKMVLPRGMVTLLMHRYPRRPVEEAILTGKRYDAAACLQAGFIDRALPEADLLPAAIEYAASQAGKDRSTLAGLKQMLHAEALPILTAPKPT